MRDRVAYDDAKSDHPTKRTGRKLVKRINNLDVKMPRTMPIVQLKLQSDHFFQNNTRRSPEMSRLR